MAGLLVSVRDASEAAAALAGGATLIDIKEPARGSLGAAEPGVWRSVAEMVGDRVPLSVALGELREWDAERGPAADLQRELAGFCFAKLGLAGCVTAVWDWRERWREVLARLPRGVSPVGVVYADARGATAAPRAEEVIFLGRELGCKAVLVDTWDKTRGDLLAHVGLRELGDWICAARAGGMQVVLAGSLTERTVLEVLPLAPDWIAVRGAVCSGPRTASVEVSKVARLARLVAEGI